MRVVLWKVVKFCVHCHWGFKLSPLFFRRRSANVCNTVLLSTPSYWLPKSLYLFNFDRRPHSRPEERLTIATASSVKNLVFCFSCFVIIFASWAVTQCHTSPVILFDLPREEGLLCMKYRVSLVGWLVGFFGLSPKRKRTPFSSLFLNKYVLLWRCCRIRHHVYEILSSSSYGMSFYISISCL